MNIKNAEELLEVTEFIDEIGEYVIRKFMSSGNYVIIDNIGDFIILEKDITDQLCSALWNDITPQEKLN